MMVIDADIARAAGETVHPVSGNCRNFLEAVKNNGHILVMTHEICDEWNRHQSNFSRCWRKYMVSRKQFRMLKIQKNEKSERELPALGLTDKQEKIALKDCHLVDAAIKSGKTIASGDDEAKYVFSVASEKKIILKDLIWVNPKTMGTVLTGWLENKNRPEKRWFLSGYNVRTCS